jgi:hypothetical protein
MKIYEAKVEDVLNVVPNLSINDAEDIITFGNPEDTIEETIAKLNGAPSGECAAI